MNVIIDGVRYVPAPSPCANPTLLDAMGDFPDAGGEITIREFLCKLLSELWNKGESFSGKRPFGNGGWEYPIYEVLIREGAVQGTLDEDGRVDELERDERHKADAIVFGLIDEMCKP